MALEEVETMRPFSPSQTGPLNVPTMDLIQVEQFAKALDHMQMVTFMNIASLSVLVYDYFLTLSLEVETVWLGRWTATKVLFLLTRYLPFIDMTLALIPQILPHATPHDCRVAYTIAAWMFVSGIALAEIILTIRAWAVWEQDPRLTIGLPIFFIMCWAPNFAIMGIYLRSLKFEQMPFPELTGCIITNSSSKLYLEWVLLMVYDSGIGSLMILKGIQSYRIGGDTGLFRAVYRDGVVYYMYLAALSIGNVVIVVTLASDYATLLSSLERTMHAILTCRVLLQLRHQANKRSISMGGMSSMQSIVSGPIVFASSS